MTLSTHTEIPPAKDSPISPTAAIPTTHTTPPTQTPSTYCGRAWRTIKLHPTWIPVVSTFYGVGEALFYTTTAAVSITVMAAGLIGCVVTALIPSEKASKVLRERMIVLLTGSEIFFSTSCRLTLRGVVAAVPVVGNGIIIATDLYNKKPKDNFFCLLEEADIFQASHTKQS